MNIQIEWQRAFIRSGFNPRQEDGVFDFRHENDGIQQFLSSIFERIGQAENYDRGVFSPTSTTVDESAWLAAIEDLHTGSEGGKSDMDRFDMSIMDTYMAGIVRWVNAAGIETTFSCDGHRYQKAQISASQDSQQVLLGYFLLLISKGDWRITASCLHKRRERPDCVIRRWRDAEERGSAANYDRSWLLEMAEALHKNQSSLREFVKGAEEVAQQTIK